MTPNALKSSAVKQEWRYARKRGKHIYLVIFPGCELDIASQPRWMRTIHWYDLRYDEQWTRLTNDLQTTREIPRVPFMADDLPESFVSRHAECETLVRLLRDPTTEEPLAITTALIGAGGFGKTTLAKAVCHDERIKEAFDDGILWVTLSEDPGDLKLKLLDLIEVLSGDRPGFATREAATARLAELLADRDILMVIDDVWNAADLDPFLQGGNHCARLITTRNRDVLRPSAYAVDVDAMQWGEADALLSMRLPHECGAQIHALAARLGQWPLLLKLTNGVLHKRVATGLRLLDALALVNVDLDEIGPTTFDVSDYRQRDQAVTATVTVSLKELGEGRRLCSELAIFPPDIDIPFSAVERLWGATGNLSSLRVQKLCERLNDLSLLQSWIWRRKQSASTM